MNQMTKAEAVKTVVESASFWRGEDLRVRGALTALTDADAVTCDDVQAKEAWKILGNRAFLSVFNETYLR